MKYGYVEMRAKMPKGQGLWPAFWMLNHYDNGNQPEIDIMEFLGREIRHGLPGLPLQEPGSSGTLEFEGPGLHERLPHLRREVGAQVELTFYVDGRETNRYESGSVSNEDMYIIVNLALGGSWGGEVDGSTPFPARYDDRLHPRLPALTSTPRRTAPSRRAGRARASRFLKCERSIGPTDPGASARLPVARIRAGL